MSVVDETEQTPQQRRDITTSGTGEDQRVAPARWYGFTAGGARFMVAAEPAAVLRMAVSQLEAVGFALGDDTFQRLLSESGSEWLAQDLRLGDVKKSWKRGVVAWAVEDTGLEFFKRFWRGATPTLVVASARATAQGAELVIFPHLSIRGGSDQNDAGPLIRQTLQALEQQFSQAGTLISVERMRGIKNDGSPASQKVVRDLLGWR